ncbi:MAG: hypothetical protein MUP81_03150 [Dehalococcoidia bacterium]|nr:hypothetical protein [Dehalococcoidia bacterium]
MTVSTKCTNFDTGKNSSEGGAVRVTIAATVGQGNGGTSQYCRECYVTCPTANTGPVRMNISAAASAVLGIEIPESTQIQVPIDDISKLYFYSATNGDVVDIMWRN